MLAIGDVNFLSKDVISAIRRALSACAQKGEIRSRLRLGEIHCRGPLPAYDCRQICVFNFWASMRLQGFNCAMTKQGAQRKSHIGAIPDFRAGGIENERQSHAAMMGICR